MSTPDSTPSPTPKPVPADALSRRKVGALWTKTSAAGNKYLAGVITIGGRDIKIVLYRNARKESEKHPDYEVFLMREETMVKEIPL